MKKVPDPYLHCLFHIPQAKKLFLYKILTQLLSTLQTLIRFMAISTMTSLSGLVCSPFSKIRINFPCIAKFLQFDMIHKSVGNSNEIHWILMHFVFHLYAQFYLHRSHYFIYFRQNRIHCEKSSIHFHAFISYSSNEYLCHEFTKSLIMAS